MKRAELLARIVIGALLLVAVALPLWTRARTPLMHASMADGGGWAPDVLAAMVGQPLHLRLTSDDVTHGFAVGQMDMQGADIEPGKVTDVTLLFKKPGTYTFYCTRWCGINHWRMRGTIEVSGSGSVTSAPAAPLYAKLGIDLDAPHEAAVIPDSPPSAPAVQPESSGALSIAKFTSMDFYRAHSPYEVWRELRSRAALSKLNDGQVWSMVAFIWQANTTEEDLAEGQALYSQNCAACHGESGKGNGVFADQLAQTGKGTGPDMMIERPVNFTDAKRILGASPALLEGKMLRGGMGTGMPAWGPIFTEQQIWKIVGYLYTFQFQEFTK